MSSSSFAAVDPVIAATGTKSSGGSCGQHVRLPPRGVVRFLRRHVLKLEFWHFGHSTKKIGFCFRIGICGVFYKKSPAFGTLHCPKTCSPLPFASFFSVFSCVCRISIGFCSVLAISRLSAHAGFDLHLSFKSVRGDFS